MTQTKIVSNATKLTVGQEGTLVLSRHLAKSGNDECRAVVVKVGSRWAHVEPMVNDGERLPYWAPVRVDAFSGVGQGNGQGVNDAPCFETFDQTNARHRRESVNARLRTNGAQPEIASSAFPWRYPSSLTVEQREAFADWLDKHHDVIGG